MDENQIAQQVQKNLPQVEAPSSDPAPVVAEDTEPLHNNLPLENMVLEQKLFDYFNVNRGSRNSVETKQQLQSIINWAKENTTSTEMTDLINTIMHQERMMGIQLKDDRLFRLYRFAKLNQQRLMLEDQMKALYG